jgi:hypothetical protein
VINRKLRMMVAVLATVVTMSGCATGYQPSGLTGGFTDVQLDTDTFRVAFNGNGYTSPERAQELMLLRMADITLSHGHSYFLILDSHGRIENETVVLPGSTSYYSTSSYGRYGGSTSGFAVSTPATVMDISKPRTNGTFRTFAERPDVNNVYNAAFLCRTLAAAYKATCGQVKVVGEVK